MNDFEQYMQNPAAAQDRVTAILNSRAPQQPNAGLQLPMNTARPVNYDIPTDMSPQQMQQARASAYDQVTQAAAAGDPQARATKKFADRTFGQDEPAKASFIEHAHASPESIDPSNSYQMNTAYARWARETGYSGPQMPSPEQISIQDLGNIASGKGTNYLGIKQDAEKHIATIGALGAKAAGGTGAYAQQFALVKAAHPEWTDADVQDYVYTRGQTNKAVNINPDGSLALKAGTTDIISAQEKAKQDAANQSDLEYKPHIARNVAEQTPIGARAGEEAALLADREAALPQLEQTLSKIRELGKKATYTKVGKGVDSLVRQSGMGATEGATALADYTTRVNLQIFPMLRQTFGAQFTKAEGDSLLKTLGAPDLSPPERDAILNAFIDQQTGSISTGKRRIGQSPDHPMTPKNGGVLHVDANGNKAMVFPDGSYEEVQ